MAPQAQTLPLQDTLACREDARFMYKRTPEAIRPGSPELGAAFALLQRLWVKDYQNVWAALQVGWWVGRAGQSCCRRAGGLAIDWVAGLPPAVGTKAWLADAVASFKAASPGKAGMRCFGNRP